MERLVLLAVFVCGALSPLLLLNNSRSVGSEASKASSSLRVVDDGTEDPRISMRMDPFDGEEMLVASPPPENIASSPLVKPSFVRQHYVTAVVMSYPKSSRFHLLEEIIKKCSQWPFVWEILLVWNGNADLIPERIRQLQTAIPSKFEGSTMTPSMDLLIEKRTQQQRAFFRILPQAANRVDNRWRIAAFVDTDAILNMDDDINLYEEGGRCMFDVWRASPSSLVAIDVRSHFLRDRPSEFGKYGYVARDRSQGYKQYSIALPRALLTHRTYFEAYDAAWLRSATTPTGINGVKDVVDDLLCDDIAFNFIAANTSLTHNTYQTGATVVYAKAKYRAYPESHAADGMTKMEGMKAKRQRCVNVLADVVGHGHVVLKHRPWHVLCEVDG